MRTWLISLCLAMTPLLARAQAASPASEPAPDAPPPSGAALAPVAPRAALAPVAPPPPASEAGAATSRAPAAPATALGAAPAQPNAATRPVVTPSGAPAPRPPSPPGATPLPAPPVYVAAPPQAASPARAGADARSAQVYAELGSLDAQLRALRLERRRVSLAGPIATMAAGYGVALGTAIVALASFGVAEDIEHGRHLDEDQDVNRDGYVDHKDERAMRNASRVLTAVSGASLAAGIFGTVWFVRRLAERRRSSPELHDLEERRRELRRELEYGASLDGSSLGLRLSGRF